MSRGNARIYNTISLVFVTLSVIWVIIVIVLLVTG
jgi:hypothetical protein